MAKQLFDGVAMKVSLCDYSASMNTVANSRGSVAVTSILVYFATNCDG